MKVILFGTKTEILSKWVNDYQLEDYYEVYDLSSLENVQKNHNEFILIVDYDTVATQVNKLIVNNILPPKTIILEKTPEVLIGKNLILHGVKAYGNTYTHNAHFQEMCNAVKDDKIWTYPELTAYLSKLDTPLSDEAYHLLEHRLSKKEIEVVYAILEGLTNDAIANKIGATVRTVKAHISSIFQKLHINDRVSLVLLLK